jgi:hypothetical protein
VGVFVKKITISCKRNYGKTQEWILRRLKCHFLASEDILIEKHFITNGF